MKNFRFWVGGIFSQTKKNLRILLKDFRSLIILLIFIWIFQTIIFWLIYSGLNNTLQRNGNWKSTKTNLEICAYGDIDFFQNHQTLAFNFLNLAAWHGYEEVSTSLNNSFSEIEFDFFLPKESYITFLYNYTNNESDAIRFSNYPGFESAQLKISSLGQFSFKEFLPIKPFTPDKWHHAKIKFFDTNQTLICEVDQKEIFRKNLIIKNQTDFGFKGSFKGGYIDNVTAKDAIGHKIFNENFMLHDQLSYKYAMVFYLIMICLSLAIFLATASLSKKKISINLFRVIIINLSILCILSLLEVYLIFFYFNKYPNPESKISKIIQTVKFYKIPEDNNWIKKTVSDIKNSVKYDQTKKVMFIGSSQTWGSGSTKKTDTFVNVAETLANSFIETDKKPIRLNQDNDLPKYQFINAGIPGATSKTLLDIYENDLVDLGHKVLIINLSNNDSDAITFEQNLTKFLTFNQAKKITTIFMLEPNSTENRDVLPLHKIMKEVATKYNIQVIDMQTYLNERKDTGFIWWDEVHASSYGQKLMANYIFENIKEIIKTQSYFE